MSAKTTGDLIPAVNGRAGEGKLKMTLVKLRASEVIDIVNRFDPERVLFTGVKVEREGQEHLPGHPIPAPGTGLAVQEAAMMSAPGETLVSLAVAPTDIEGD